MNVGENVDLHCHSTASDGDLSPHDLVLRAHQQGVTTLALTDHDTVAGLLEAQQAAEAMGMQLVSGIEVSCLWHHTTLHIVALNFGFANPVIEALQHAQTQARSARSEKIAHALVKKGLPDLLEDVRAIAPEGIPGRPHFAQLMLERGLVKSMEEAFKRYLGAGKVGDVQSCWRDMSEIMPILNQAGATCVIAHPCKYKLSWMRLRALFQEFRDLGGQGIEVAVSGHSPSEMASLAQECRRFGLKASVGSDFHSPRYSWAELGRAPTLPTNVTPIWEEWVQCGVVA